MIYRSHSSWLAAIDVFSGFLPNVSDKLPEAPE